MEIFADDFAERPYWWKDAPPEDGRAHSELADADFLVIGAGLTGLNAAITLRQAGAQVTVIDAERIGEAASTRNGGQIRAESKMAFASLAQQIGEAGARAAFDDFARARSFLPERIAALGIDCDYQWNGFFFGAHTRRDHAAQIANHEASLKRGRDLGEVFDRDRMKAHQIRTDLYHGGYLYRDGGQLHPARCHLGLRRKAVELGAALFSQCRARSIRREGERFLVDVGATTISARKVILATNGYTDAVSPYVRRRLVPARSYMIATEPLAPGLAAALIPGDNPIADTKMVLYYFRTSPDKTRILFGGRASFRNESARLAAKSLHGFLTSVFPELAKVRVTNAWYGNFALGLDFLQHIGEHDGVHYAVACNGSGVMSLSYLGHCAALRAMGDMSAAEGLARAPFPAKPLYNGRPWFLPIVGALYRGRDRLNTWTDHAA